MHLGVLATILNFWLNATGRVVNQSALNPKMDVLKPCTFQGLKDRLT